MDDRHHARSIRAVDAVEAGGDGASREAERRGVKPINRTHVAATAPALDSPPRRRAQSLGAVGNAALGGALGTGMALGFREARPVVWITLGVVTSFALVLALVPVYFSGD